MFFLHSKNGLSEWVRQNMGEWESVATATVFIFPKPIQLYQSASQFLKSISLGFIAKAEMKEKWESLRVRLPHPNIYHYFLSTLISGLLTYKFAVYFLTTVASLYLLLVCHIYMQTEKCFQILSDFGWFSIYYCLPSSILLSVLPRKAMYGFLFDSACQSDSFKQGREAYKMKKKSTADLPRATVFIPCTQHTKKLKILFRNKWKKQMGLC